MIDQLLLDPHDETRIERGPQLLEMETCTHLVFLPMKQSVEWKQTFVWSRPTIPFMLPLLLKMPSQSCSQLFQLLCCSHRVRPPAFLTHSAPICSLARENRPTFHQAARQEVAIDPHRSVTGPNRSKRGESMSWPLRGRWHLGPSCLFLLSGALSIDIGYQKRLLINDSSLLLPDANGR
jgi:hypothetical protein